MNISWFDAENLFPKAIDAMEKVDVVLDIGCGIIPQRFIRPLVHICCEPFAQYVEHLQEKIKDEFDRNYVVIKATWAEAINIFPPKSVDTVFLVDVIEHLEKEEALKLLHATEGIAKQQVVLFTPLGFMPQHHADGKDAWGLDGAHWQEHKSGWQPEDFGDQWEIFASKVYHVNDNMGRVLEAPYGAMWAIKTLKHVEIREPDPKRVGIRKFTDLAIEYHRYILNKPLLGMIDLLVKMKRNKLAISISNKLLKR